MQGMGWSRTRPVEDSVTIRSGSKRARRLQGGRSMTIRLLFVLAAWLAAATPCFAAQPQSGSGNTNCSGLLGGGSSATNIFGNVTVPAGGHCTLSFVNIKGNVQVGKGATLLVSAYTEPSTIGGN